MRTAEELHTQHFLRQQYPPEDSEAWAVADQDAIDAWRSSPLYNVLWRIPGTVVPLEETNLPILDNPLVRNNSGSSLRPLSRDTSPVPSKLSEPEPETQSEGEWWSGLQLGDMIALDGVATPWPEDEEMGEDDEGEGEGEVDDVPEEAEAAPEPPAAPPAQPILRRGLRREGALVGETAFGLL